MNILQRIPAVFCFEWRRAFTIPRLAWMIVLMGFPPLILAIISSSARRQPPEDVAAVLVYILSPCVATMMSVFLWATPALSSELEGRSWVYLAIRPHGPLSVLMGKYLVAVSWSIPVGIVSAVLGVWVLGVDDPKHMIVVECGLVLMSCISYSALFLLIGIIAPKRAMVIGILYALIAEVALALIPAAVNLLTVQYRLRCLLVRWMDMEPPTRRRSPVLEAYFGDESAWWHVSILVGMTAAYLIAAAILLRYREFTAASETDT